MAKGPTHGDMNPKLPPQDLEAEKSVLGALMLDKNAILRVVDFLEERDFYVPAHQKIYVSIMELFERNQPIDVLTVTTKLKDKNQIDSIGGPSYLTELINAVPSAAHVEHYGGIVRQKKVLRELLTTAAHISEDVFSRQEDPEEMLDVIEQRIFALNQKSKTYAFTPIADHLKAAYERMEKNLGMQGLSGISSGFKGLDTLLSGFQKSDMVILGARPSMGKTAVTLDMVRGAAKAGASVAVFSLEMSKEQIIDRLIATESGVPLWNLRSGRITDEMDFQMIQAALDRLSRMKIYIDDTPSPTTLQIRSMARKLKMEHELDLIVIDYVQLIQPSRHNENSVQQFTEISHGIKGLARELNVPVLALSQLSRNIESRGGEPKLSDLRETGSWEQDADIVMFIHRYNRDVKDLMSAEEKNKSALIVTKHRNGPLGDVPLLWNPEKVSFTEIDTVHTI
jgi:replicative DNA helicase